MQTRFSAVSLCTLRAAFAATLACCCFISALAHAQRLPQTVIPTHYTLSLSPDLQAATFSGVESIDVTLTEPTDHITLNAIEITFQSVTISAAGKEQAAAVSLDPVKEQATFTVPTQLPAGRATITIQYTGILNDKLRGFYLSKTARRNYAVSQFESTDARRAFPCFDEPAFKATFDVSLAIDAADTAISNGPIVSDTPGPAAGKHTLTFLTTPKMSTYLVASLVGDFQCTSGESDGVAIRVCATPDKVALTPFSLDIAKSVLHYYNHYFGIPYPLKKLDLIGIPDFEAGAMENFGAITSRETDLLIDPKTATVNTKREVALTVAHEMAHQWFGDLVTMKWWDNIWLNEGFATWMESKAVDALHPEWGIAQGEAGNISYALDIDAQPTTRAIRATADTRDEIEQMFDGISYNKAGAVLLSVENYLGDETFRQGVHNYLAAHLYSNATAEDFWNAQTSTSGKPVDKIMQSLVDQPGAPILTFGSPSGGSVSVTQRRFFLSPSIKPDAAQKWTLPVCFKTLKGQDCQLITPDTTSLKVPKSNLFFANASGRGYYRTAYTPADYAKLVSAVETGLSEGERISLIGDEWAQMRSNQATVGDYLNLASAVKADSSSDVVHDSINNINTIYNRIAATDEEKAQLSSWIRTTYSPVYAALGAPKATDSANLREMRADLFGLLGIYGKDPAILEQARKITQQFLTDPTSVDPTLGQTAVSIAARNGDAALYDALQHVAETSTNPEFQDGALRLLARFEDPALLERSLDYALSNKVRNQDAAIQFAIALNGDKNRDMVWHYVQSHWDKMQALFTPELGSELVGSTGAFCSATDRDDVKQFFSTHTVPAANVALRHAIERINGCIELRSLQEPNLKSWLATQPN